MEYGKFVVSEQSARTNGLVEKKRAWSAGSYRSVDKKTGRRIFANSCRGASIHRSLARALGRRHRPDPVELFWRGFYIRVVLAAVVLLVPADGIDGIAAIWFEPVVQGSPGDDVAGERGQKI